MLGEAHVKPNPLRAALPRIGLGNTAKDRGKADLQGYAMGQHGRMTLTPRSYSRGHKS